MIRLATEQPPVVVPVVVDPVPVQDPAVAIPVDVGHVRGVVGVTLTIMQNIFRSTTRRFATFARGRTYKNRYSRG